MILGGKLEDDPYTTAVAVEWLVQPTHNSTRPDEPWRSYQSPTRRIATAGRRSRSIKCCSNGGHIPARSTASVGFLMAISLAQRESSKWLIGEGRKANLEIGYCRLEKLLRIRCASAYWMMRAVSTVED